MLLHRGAEAELWRSEWHGRPCVEKVRVPKGYRHAELDDEIRKNRIRTEARLIAQARRIGISVPVVYDVDLQGHRIVMELVDGPTAKEALQRGLAGAEDIPRAVGALAGTLHRHGIVHGDLTTSNMIWRDGRLCVLDFSMGEKTSALEAQGVDLRLLKEAWTSAHFDRLPAFDEVLAAYRATYPLADKSIATMRAIEERGRYA